MKLKLDAEGHVVLENGFPVYTHDDGKDSPFDAAAATATIARVVAESKGHAAKAREARDALKAFEGIDDADAALKALGIVKNLDAKKLVDAGEVEKVRAEAIKAVEDKYAPALKERDDFRDALMREKVGGSFSRSKLITEKLAIPADLVQARFGNAFKVEGDAIVAYDQSGNKLYSRARPGEIAGFDEALELLIDAYPYRDSILKGSGATGGGSQGANSQHGGKRTMTRTQFEALDPASAADTARLAGKGDIVITD